MMTICNTCHRHKYSWQQNHRCPPLWDVIGSDYFLGEETPENDWNQYRGIDAEEALKEHLISDSDFSDGDEGEYYVRDRLTGEVKKFTASAYVELEYSINEEDLEPFPSHSNNSDKELGE